MKEFDLNDAWKNTDEQAEEYYSQIKSEIMELAQKRSESILDKLKKTILWEWAATIPILIGFLFFYKKNPYYWGGAAALILVLILTAIPYYKMWKELNNTPTQNMVACLKTYIKILDGFIQRVKKLMRYFLPIGFISGLLFSIESGATFDLSKIEWGKLGVIVAFSAVFIGGIYAFMFKYYLPKLYGNPKKELQEILDGLKGD